MHVPEGCLYAAAGWTEEGIIQTIKGELQKLFPTMEPPTFPGIAENSFVAYSYLESSVKFRLPYFQNRAPLIFTDSGGGKIELISPS